MGEPESVDNGAYRHFRLCAEIARLGRCGHGCRRIRHHKSAQHRSMGGNGLENAALFERPGAVEDIQYCRGPAAGRVAVSDGCGVGGGLKC